MRKRTLRVTFNGQVFTRITSRDYTHVVAWEKNGEAFDPDRAEYLATLPDCGVASWHTSRELAQEEAERQRRSPALRGFTCTVCRVD